jgi:hypothetical protein
MSSTTLDPGTAFPVFDAAAERGMVVFTDVCPGARCTLLHLDAVETARTKRLDPTSVPREEHLFFELDVANGQLTAEGDRARAYLESERGAGVRAWFDHNAEALRVRFERLKAQQTDEGADARPAPAWRPGALVFHHDLFPHDFTPVVSQGDRLFYILDACCPDPGCGCDEEMLVFQGAEGEHASANGRLGQRRPAHTEGAGRALWDAIRADRKILGRLEDRRDEIRRAGPFIVGSAYEGVRLAAASRRARGEADAQDREGGYLAGGAIPLDLVRRSFDLGARLRAARFTIGEAWWSWFRVEVSGAITRDTWAIVDDEPCLSLHEAPRTEVPWLDFAVPDRAGVPLEHRRQRCALGLPLLGGAALPLILKTEPDGSYALPGADDVRLALAVGEAVLAMTPELSAHEPQNGQVLEHRAELDTGTAQVRITVSLPDAPWDASEMPLDIDDEDEDDGKGEDEEGGDSTRHALEAFTDAALDRGVPLPVVEAARSLVGGLGEYVAERGQGAPRYDDATVTRFLEVHAPRKLTLAPDQIALAPAALHAFADWLDEVGHADGPRLRAALDRALPTFQKRARDPRGSSPARENATPAAEGAVSGSPSRWRPAPGQSPPAPTDPCGCGSGRRYKKCCMPR